MKVKTKSFLGKLAIVLVSYGMSVLHWCNLLPGATIQDIWGAGATAYGILLGSIDFNICHDSWVEVKQSVEGESEDGR